jgi:peptidyl-prolyl cis-trans isomerase C
MNAGGTSGRGRRTATVAVVLALLVAVAALPAASATKKSTKTSAKPAAKSSKSAAKPAGTDSNEVLVRIGKDTITRADVQRRIDSLPEQFRANYATPDGRKQLLDRMVEERVWLTEALEAKVDVRPQVKQQLEQQRRDLLIRTYLNELMATSPQVSDSEARDYYVEHQADYRVPATVTVRHIQTKTEKDAKKVKEQATKGGKDWMELVKKFSTDTLTKSTGGNLGTVTKDGAFGALGMQPALSESAFAQREGAIAGPYKTDRGWHVLRVDQVKPESVRPFEQVKPMIARQLGSQRSQDFYKSRLEQAREDVGVRPDSNAINRFLVQRRTAREMFNDAQAVASPEQRIDAYRKLIAQYPDSEVTAQAQFMIGFVYSEELKNYEEAEAAFKTLLQRWPKAELASSAQWMIEHMRTEDAPAFIDTGADSAAAPAPADPRKRPKSTTGGTASGGKPAEQP